MNVYVIYKFSDFNEVSKKLEEIKNTLENVSLFYFSPEDRQKNWHKIAKEKIKQCNMVLFFDCFEEKCSPSLKHIKWELEQAKKHRKKIVVCKKDNNIYVEGIYETDYSDKKPNDKKYDKENPEKIISYLKEEAEWCVENSLINKTKAIKDSKPDPNFSNEEKSLLLEQYRMMIQTSEKLMERRQAMVNLYITICTALIAFIGASFGFDNIVVTSIIAFLSGIIIIILCLNWHSSLNAYELNNSGKFEVINEIEKNLPADMFNCEYKHNKKKGFVSYSTRKKMLPIIFAFFGVLLIIFSGILFFVK